MKKFRFVFFTVALSLFASNSSFAQDSPQELQQMLEMWDKIALQPTKYRVENARTSEQLLALGDAGRINIFADATHFSANSQPVSMDADYILRNWVFEIAGQEHLSWRRSSEQTLLFWKEPDVVSIAKTLLAETARSQAEQMENPKGPEASISPRPDSSYLDIALYLADYLEKEQGWDGKSPLTSQFKLFELPAQESTGIMSAINQQQKNANQGKQSFWTSNAAWLRDENWQNARLLYSQPPAQPTPILAVKISQGNAQSFTSLQGRAIMFPNSVERPQFNAGKAIPINNENSVMMSQQELSTDVALAVPVSLQIKEANVKEVLSEMQKQSGVTFEVSPTFDSRQRVTARTFSYPLQQTMKALSEVYGVGWTKTGAGTYRMQSALSPTHTAMLQVGDTLWYSYWRSPIVRDAVPADMILDEPIDWQREFVQAGFDASQLQAPEGVAIADLPLELQTIIRQSIEQSFATDLLKDYHDAFDTFTPMRVDEITVSVSPTGTQPRQRGINRLARKQPLLQAELIKNGESIGSFPIYDQQMRQVVGNEADMLWQRQQQGQTQQP